MAIASVFISSTALSQTTISITLINTIPLTITTKSLLGFNQELDMNNSYTTRIYTDTLSEYNNMLPLSVTASGITMQCNVKVPAPIRVGFPYGITIFRGFVIFRDHEQDNHITCSGWNN